MYQLDSPAFNELFNIIVYLAGRTFNELSNIIVYLAGKSLPILRGTWFVDGTGQPLEYEYSLQLEQDHLTKFRGMSIPDSQTDGKKAGKTEG